MGYAQVLPSGEYLVRGVQSSVRYPFIMARYQPNGPLVRQQTGRKMFGFVQDLVPLGTAGFLLTASIPEGSASNVASCMVPEDGGVALGSAFKANLWEKYRTAAPVPRRQLGTLSSKVQKAYKS